MIAPDGKATVWGAHPVFSEDRRIQYYNGDTPGWTRDNAYVVGFTGDGRRIVIASDHEETLTLDAATGAVADVVRGLRCSNDLRGEPWIDRVRLICLSGRPRETYTVFSAPAAIGPFVLPLDPGWRPSSFSFLSEGRHLAYAEDEIWRADRYELGDPTAAKLRIVRIDDGAVVYDRSIAPMGGDTLRRTSVSEDGSRAATIVYRDGAASGEIEVWDLPPL
jgi:hypothetical protein